MLKRFIGSILCGMVMCAGAVPGYAADTSSDNSSGVPAIAKLSDAVTRQETTFNLEKRSKTFHVKRGEKVTLAETTKP